MPSGSSYENSLEHVHKREFGNEQSVSYNWQVTAGSVLSDPHACRCLCPDRHAGGSAAAGAGDALRIGSAGAALYGAALGGIAGLGQEVRQLPPAPERLRPTNLTGGLPDYVIKNLREIQQELDLKKVPKVFDGKDDRSTRAPSVNDGVSGRRLTDSRVLSTPEGVVGTSPNFDPHKKVNVVVYTHGNYDDHNGWSRRANLETAMKSMSENTVVIVPPTNVSAAGLDKALRKLGITNENIGHVSFMGHSAGGAALGRLLTQTDTPQYRHLSPHAVTAMSTLYGPSRALEDWARHHKGDTNRTLHVVYEPGTTQRWTHDLATRLKPQTRSAGMHIDYQNTPVRHMQQPAYYLTHLSQYR